MKLTTISDLAATQDLRPALGIMEMLGDHYLKFIERDTGSYEYNVFIGGEMERKPGIHASEISGCQRRFVYGIGVAGIERRPDPTATDVNMKMRFRLGHAVHAMVQTDLVRMCAAGPMLGPDAQLYDLSFVPELKIDRSLGGPAADHDVDSSSDGLFTLSQNGIPVIRLILEIKTKSKDEYDKLKTPEKDHVEQAHLYMGCLDVPFTWMLYYNKSNSNFTKPQSPYVFRFSDKLWAELEMRFLRSNHMAFTGTLPDRSESIACRWCPFSYVCQPKILTTRFSSAPPNSAAAARRLGVLRQ